jgi:hypothetical protein
MNESAPRTSCTGAYLRCRTCGGAGGLACRPGNHRSRDTPPYTRQVLLKIRMVWRDLSHFQFQQQRSAVEPPVGGLTNHFFLKDRGALRNQMSFALTFPWRGFVLAVRDGNRPNKNEIATSVFGVTAKDFSHGHAP